MNRESTDPANRPPPDLPLLQFGLRTMFLTFAGVSVLFAVLAVVPGRYRLMLLVAVSSVVCHLAAATFGHRLRSNSERRRRWHTTQGQVDPDQVRARPPRPATMTAPTAGPLGMQSTRLPWMPLGIACGAIVGGAIGFAGLTTYVGDQITLAGTVLGSSSTALLGAWLTFLAWGFVGISRHAWRDAVTHEQRNAQG